MAGNLYQTPLEEIIARRQHVSMGIPLVETKALQTSRYGSKVTVTSKRARKRKKKSLKQRVRELEKNQDIKSKYHLYNKVMYQLKQTFGPVGINAQQKIYFWLPGATPTLVESLIDGIQYPTGEVNLTNNLLYNTTNKISCFDHFTFKNSNLYTVYIKYVKVKCNDHTAISPINMMKREAIDRGFTVTNNVVTAAVAATGFSAAPSYLALPSQENHNQFLSYSYDNAESLWKKTDDVQSVVLNPGDSFDIYDANKYDYKPEVIDTEAAQTYIKDYSYGVVMEVIGELSHGSGVGEDDIIGYSDWDIDGCQKSKVTFTVDNGLGVDQVVVNDSDINTPGTVTSFVQYGAMNIQQ